MSGIQALLPLGQPDVLLREVAYTDIDRIEVTNVTPFTNDDDMSRPKKAVAAFIVTKRGHRMPFWPKLFPRDAVNRFFDLAG